MHSKGIVLQQVRKLLDMSYKGFIYLGRPLHKTYVAKFSIEATMHVARNENRMTILISKVLSSAILNSDLYILTKITQK